MFNVTYSKLTNCAPSKEQIAPNLGDSVCRNASNFSVNGIFKFPYSGWIFMKHPTLHITPSKTEGLSCRAVGDNDNPSPDSTAHEFYKPPRKCQAVTEVDDVYR